MSLSLEMCLRRRYHPPLPPHPTPSRRLINPHRPINYNQLSVHRGEARNDPHVDVQSHMQSHCYLIATCSIKGNSIYLAFLRCHAADDCKLIGYTYMTAWKASCNSQLAKNDSWQSAFLEIKIDPTLKLSMINRICHSSGESVFASEHIISITSWFLTEQRTC